MKKRKISFSQAINEGIYQSMKTDKKIICYGLGMTDPRRIFNTTEKLVEEFGEFCEEHGMEVLTNESQKEEAVVSNGRLTDTSQQQQQQEIISLKEDSTLPTNDDDGTSLYFPTRPSETQLSEEDHDSTRPMSEVGLTKESLLLADEAE